MYFCTNSQPKCYLSQCALLHQLPANVAFMSLSLILNQSNASLSHFQRALLHQLPAEVVFLSAIQCALLHQLPTKLFFFVTVCTFAPTLSQGDVYCQPFPVCTVAPTSSQGGVYSYCTNSGHSFTLTVIFTNSQPRCCLSAIANEHFCTNSQPM